MANLQRVVAVDFGSSSLKAGLFQVDKVNGLSLMGYRVVDLGIDPGNENEAESLIQSALQQAIDELGARNLPVYCSISGQYAFLRFVKLPPVSAGQLDEMIGFEAQQNVPFPIEEVVWDYQLITAPEGSADVNALLVALKEELVEETIAPLQPISPKVNQIDVAPVALINAYLYNYSSSPQCTLLIDIGAKCTSLIFFEGNQIFARVVPIGGHMITQNISNEFQEPYKSAEMLKKGKGFVGLGGAYQDPDDQAAARISKVARSVYSRLHAEINRSVSFYRNQQGGSAPARIMLAGGGAGLTYSDLFFKDKFGVEVEYFNPLISVAVANEVNQSELAHDAYSLGEVVGLALRDVGECPVEIDLKPKSLIQERQKKGQIPVLTFAMMVWLFAFLLIIGATYFRYTQVQEVVGQLTSDLSQKDRISTEIQKAESAFEALKIKEAEMTKLVKQRSQWRELLMTIDTATRELTGLWISELEIGHNDSAITVVPLSEQTPPQNNRRGRRPPPDTGPKPINLAPFATEVNIRGFYEIDQGYEIVNRYVQNLQGTGLFSEVKILSRATSVDEVAQSFYLQAIFNEEQRMDLIP
ncbi:MAG: type IV pilus assembly protein PilM [Verrucomicrobiota bacterium]